MFLDVETRVSNNQGPIIADANSESSYDRGNATSDMMEGAPLYWVITITEAFNNLTSLNVTTISGSGVSGTGAINAGEQLQGPTLLIPLAQLTLNNTIIFPLHLFGPSLRYVGLDYDVVGTAPSTGKVTAILTATPQRNPVTQF